MPNPSVSKRRVTGQMRRLFLFAMLRQIRLLWPILSAVVIIMAATGVVIGRIEGWLLIDALYFTFVTGLTIGYGDLTPKHTVARLLALAVGLAGIILTGLIAAISVQALATAGKAIRRTREN